MTVRQSHNPPTPQPSISCDNYQSLLRQGSRYLVFLSDDPMASDRMAGWQIFHFSFPVLHSVAANRKISSLVLIVPRLTIASTPCDQEEIHAPKNEINCQLLNSRHNHYALTIYCDGSRTRRNRERNEQVTMWSVTIWDGNSLRSQPGSPNYQS